MFECLKHSNEYKTFENKLINKNYRIQNKLTEYSVLSSDRLMFCANIPTLCWIALLMLCITLFKLSRLSFSSLSDLSIISNTLCLSVISYLVNFSWDSLIKADVSLWSSLVLSISDTCFCRFLVDLEETKSLLYSEKLAAQTSVPISLTWAVSSIFSTDEFKLPSSSVSFSLVLNLFH